MQHRFKLSSGLECWLSVLTGEVIQVDKAHATEIHQTDPTILGSRVIPGAVTSSTTSHTELWLRAADGREHPFNLTNLSIPMRPGHLVSVAWGAPAHVGSGPIFALRNHTTQASVSDLDGALPRDIRHWNLVGGGASWAIMGGLSAIGLFAGLGLAFAGGQQVAPQDLLLGASIGLVIGGMAGMMLGGSASQRQATKAINDFEAQSLQFLASLDGGGPT
ncbi:hypothetical protein [Roseateles sp. MS654]|uniref:hypothetical protein n=1 Tax=Roseateles sp. MS654 TaxID=3412685 RepID=UPI003C2F2788